MNNPNEADLEEVQQEDALFPWLADGSMADSPEDHEAAEQMWREERERW